MISPNEIKNRALAFSLEWALETRDDAEAKTFWDDFFEVFGITRRRVASFEHPIKKLDDTQGYADLLWKGVLLVEHKSKGKSLDTAYKQAIDYFPGLKEKELPRYIIVSDFEKFRVYDLDEDKQYGFPTRELSKYIDLFGFISGHENQVDYEVEVAANIQAAELMAEFHNEISKTGYTGPDLEVFLIRVLFCLFADDTGIFRSEAANIQAAELMAEFHNEISKTGYTGPDLEVFLIRVLFCLFADDTGIFPKDVFKNYINNRTDVDGSDLGSKLAQIFQVLNTPEKKRQSNLDDDLAKIPYVNGGIFSRNIGIVSCDVTTKLRLE